MSRIDALLRAYAAVREMEAAVGAQRSVCICSWCRKRTQANLRLMSTIITLEKEPCPDPEDAIVRREARLAVLDHLLDEGLVDPEEEDKLIDMLLYFHGVKVDADALLTSAPRPE